jgi:hypothetical protein
MVVMPNKQRAILPALSMLLLMLAMPSCAAEKAVIAKQVPSVVNSTNKRSPMGLNLAEIVDYSSSLPFVDIFRSARPFPTDLDLDKSGWVRSLKKGQSAPTYLNWDIPGKYPSGVYKVLYEGKGKIVYGAATKTISHRPGLDLISVNAEKGGIQLTITKTDPKDYIRNIRVIMPGGVCDNKPLKPVKSKFSCRGGTFISFEESYTTNIFNPALLKFIQPFKVLRFMDMMKTNNSKISSWNERTQLNAATWSNESGAPIEVMVDLANQMHADPWFNMPHKANDDYIRHFAEYVKKNLDPDLKVYIEYSNETWNTQFEQTQYMNEQGQKLKLDPDLWQSGQRYYSQRAVEIFHIWKKVFNDADSLVRVLATQAANAYFADFVLSHNDAYKQTDALAIAPYFGAYLGLAENNASKESVGGLFGRIRKIALPEAIEWMKKNAAVAKKHHVDLIAYEGGQHLTGVLGEENNETLNKLFDRVNRNSQMRTTYERYFDAWRKANGKLFVYFSAPGRYSKWGRWGITESLYDSRKDAPKYDAVMRFIENNPRWW